MLRLGTFQGGSSEALAVNGIGLAAGQVSFDIAGGYRPALFIPGFAPLPIHTDGPGEATGINNRTEISGWFRQGGYTQAFRWFKGHIETLASLGGGHSHAAGINNRSEIVGWSEAAPGASHAMYWWKDKFVDLGTWGGYAAQATAINDHGDIVGFREVVQNGVGVRQGVRALRGKAPQLLPTPPGFDAVVPTSINDHGDITGYVYPATNFLFGRVAFIYSNGKYRLMPNPAGHPTVGLCINNRRDVAGFHFDGNADPRNRGTLWLDKGDTAVGLDYLPAALSTGWTDLADATALNDAGVIVGYGLRVPRPGRSSLEAFMLVPTHR
ncbi:hypothetical protein [Azohydromonas aeria]|uniref:hypothetical protein n=1 Tax=Azohydromonas aeria TaxID=2590212 RepID=UPI0012FA2057|nr:hypothetical protein [Azohydromonas aeria]